MKKITHIAILILVLSSAHCLSAWAASENAAADFLVKLGDEFYRQGNTDDAVHEYSKALLLDPSHEKAKEHLKKLGFSEGLYGRSRTYQSEFIDLTQHLNEYKQKTEQLEKQKQTIEEKLAQLRIQHEELYKSNLAKEMELEILKHRVDGLSKNLVVQKDEFKRRTNDLEESYGKSNQALQAKLEKTHKELSQKTLSSNQDEVKTTLADLKLYDALDKALAYQDRAVSLKGQNQQLKDQLWEEHSLRESLFKILEDYVYVRKNEMDSLEDNLIFAKIDLVKNQNKLKGILNNLFDSYQSADGQIARIEDYEARMNDKNKGMDFLKTKLDSIQSNLAQQKKVVEEKEKKILALQNELDDLRSNKK